MSVPKKPAPIRVAVTEELLQALEAHRVFLRYNQKPEAGRYGWIGVGDMLTIRTRFAFEESVGFLGGVYKGIKGSIPASGFCPMGAFSYSYSALPEGCRIGRYCSISTGVQLIDSFHPVGALTSSALLVNPNNELFRPAMTQATRNHCHTHDITGGMHCPIIEDDVWIGADAMLAMGIRIGTGAIVAARSVVTRDVPPYAVVAGNPARVRKFRFDEQTIGRLLASRWWDIEPQDVFAEGVHDPRVWLERFEAAPSAFRRFAPRTFSFHDFEEGNNA